MGYFGPGPDCSQWRFCLYNIYRRPFGETDLGLRAAVSRGVVVASYCSWPRCPVGGAAPLLELLVPTAYSFQLPSVQLPSYKAAPAACPSDRVTQALCPESWPPDPRPPCPLCSLGRFRVSFLRMPSAEPVAISQWLGQGAGPESSRALPSGSCLL